MIGGYIFTQPNFKSGVHRVVYERFNCEIFMDVHWLDQP